MSDLYEVVSDEDRAEVADDAERVLHIDDDGYQWGEPA
jgi:hypothetical protein